MRYGARKGQGVEKEGAGEVSATEARKQGAAASIIIFHKVTVYREKWKYRCKTPPERPERARLAFAHLTTKCRRVRARIPASPRALHRNISPAELLSSLAVFPAHFLYSYSSGKALTHPAPSLPPSTHSFFVKWRGGTQTPAHTAHLAAQLEIQLARGLRCV